MNCFSKPAHWILIGNYHPDHQESMLRFTSMLADGLEQRGVRVMVVQPCVVLGRFVRNTHAGVGKWLAYIDKWLFFPFVLLGLRLANRGAWFHICDHSNAPYILQLPKKRTSLTCHDVLAIQAARGDASTHIQTGRIGHLLQAYILWGIKACPRVATVSAYTLSNLTAVAGTDKQNQRTWTVIPNALNNHFHRQQSITGLAAMEVVLSEPYLLHVGSGHSRKNRGALLRMLKALEGRWAGRVVFAGEPVGEELQAEAQAFGIVHRVVEIIKPSHELLNLLYNRCEAFIFPSYSEGFGWPLVEAQTCGAPVIANDIAVLREVSGGAALHVDADQPQQMADAFLQLQDADFRSALVSKGLHNARRYQLAEMTDAYLGLAGQAVAKTRQRAIIAGQDTAAALG